MRYVLPFLTLIILCTSLSAMEPARKADDMVESAGVCTHWNYHDTPYGQRYTEGKSLLKELGVRYIRDSFHKENLEIFNELGIKTMAVIGGPPLKKRLDILRSNPEAISEIEGPNETNGRPILYKGLKAFPKSTIMFQNDLYASVKNDPALKNIPVVAPSIAWFGSNVKLAPLKSFDYQVMHSYSGGGLPSAVKRYILEADKIAGIGGMLKPYMSTETGYHTAFGIKEEGHQGVTPLARSKYIPRTIAENFNRGITRSYIYEFICSYEKMNRRGLRSESKYGLVTYNMKRTPSFISMRNFLSILKEPGKKFKPKALDIKISNAPDTVQHTLLQKSNGDYYLLLWNDVLLYDNSTRSKNYGKDITNAAVPVRITVPEKPSSLTKYLPRISNEPCGTIPSAENFTINVPDEVIIIKITFPGKKTPDLIPYNPKNIKASGTAESINLRWDTAKQENIKGYFVWRMGEYQGFTSTPQWQNNGLVPATGYMFEIASVDNDGNVSPRSSVTAHTRNELSDLVVTAIKVNPANASAGDTVTFSATIKNTGKYPTQAKTHGISFRVDGRTVCWSDNFRKSLAPGKSVTLKATNGPKGSKNWQLTEGAHIISAYADDQDRIRESNEANNIFETGYPHDILPDLLVTNLTMTPYPPQKNAPLTLKAKITNNGKTFYKKKQKIGVSFRINGKMAGWDIANYILKPGEEKEIILNIKPDNKEAWKQLSTLKSITAHVDDVNRVPELHENNNILTLTTEQLSDRSKNTAE